MPVFLSLLSSVWGVPEDTRLYEEAERRFRSGDYQFALSRYDTLIEEYPDSEFIADAHFRKGLILLHSGKLAAAAKYLERVDRRYGYTRYAPYIPFWLAVVRYELEEYEAALEYFFEYLSGTSEQYRRDARFYSALSLRELGRTREALDLIADIPADGKELFEHSELFRLYADLLVANGKYRELLDLYAKVDIEKAPEELIPSLRLYEAEALHYLGRVEEAENRYRELLDAPGDVARIAFQRLFSLSLEKGDEEERFRILEKAQSALSGYPELLNEFYLRVGIAASRGESFELAETYLRRVYRSLSAEEMDPILPLYLSYTLERREGAEEAFRLLSEYLEELGRELPPSEPLLFAMIRLSAELEQWSALQRYGDGYRETYTGDGRSSRQSEGTADRSSTARRAARVSYLYAFGLRELGQSRAALAVLDKLSEERLEGGYYDDLLLLRGRLYMDLQEWNMAEEAFREYLPLHPAEPFGYGELIRIAFSQKRWEQVLQWAASAEKQVPGLETEYAEEYGKILYLRGLSLLGLARYDGGADVLEELVSGELFDYLGSGEIGPQSLFFAAWARYKNADYRRAIELFDRLEERFPGHPRVQEGRYLAAWAAYASGDFEAAKESFANYARFAEELDERMRGRYMHAKSLAALGERQEALSLYRQVYEEGENSGVADDALFESASILAGTGRIEEAVDRYHRLFRFFPRSSLAEEALYRRGELLLENERYAAAREAFYEHRSRFPRGELVDNSLYWGAVASRRVGEPYGAALLLE